MTTTQTPTTKVNIWETIDHRWLLRDAFTAKIPEGETYHGHASRDAAIKSAEKHGWQFSVFPS